MFVKGKLHTTAQVNVKNAPETSYKSNKSGVKPCLFFWIIDNNNLHNKG